MNQPMPGLKYQVQEMIFDTKSMLDETNFYNQRQGMPSELTKKITYILGDKNRSHPLSTMTLGGIGYGNANSAQEIEDVQFTYPVMGRRSKVNTVFTTDYSGADEPGIGNSTFYITFGDNWIKRFYVIQSSGGTQAYVLDEGEPLPTGGHRYKCQLDPAGPGDFCPVDQLVAGTNWVVLHTAVPESESRTTETNMVMPGKFKNQMSFMRTGMSWAGNAPEKMMNITMTNEKGVSTSGWMDYFMWQFEQNWMDDCEHFYWYSRYNRLADGTIPLKDLYTGKVIPRGSGVLEQIGNKSTYSRLSYNTLCNKVGDALFGQTDSGGMTITLMGGTGARREMDRCIREAGGQILGALGAGNIADKFVTGSNRNLVLGGFFDAFYHIDGYYIQFKHAQIFDTGRVADASPKHPETGLPLESYRMVFLDTADVDGSPNIVHVAQKGRAYLDRIMPGMGNMPRSLKILGGISNEGQKIAVTDVDKSAYMRFKSAGIQIMRANRCFDLVCTAGQ